jgi:Domain of unknown function (DUF1772)
MFLTLQVASVVLVAVAMALALAHALEFPGKMRLNKATYVAVQTIYYPGFTYGGLGEGLGMLATITLLIAAPTGNASWWWVLIAVIALLAMHAVYWVFTHPVNNFWLKDQELKGFARGFFALGSKSPSSAGDGPTQWERARDRWEYSHILRAILGVVALIALVVSVAL